MRERYRLDKTSHYSLTRAWSFNKSAGLILGAAGFDYADHENLIAWWRLGHSGTKGHPASADSELVLTVTGSSANSFAISQTNSNYYAVASSNSPTDNIGVIEEEHFTSTAGSFLFDGTSWDHFRMTDTDSTKFTFGDGISDSPFSIAAWINDDSNVNTAKRFIISKYRDNTANEQEWALYIEADELVFQVRDTTASNNRMDIRTAGGTSIIKNTWHHVAVTYDGSSTPGGLNIYVDGVKKIGSNVHTNTNSYVVMRPTPSPVVIGTNWGGSGKAFKGNITDVAIWNKVLSPTSVNALYTWINNPIVWIVVRDFHLKGSTATKPIDDTGNPRDINVFRQGINVKSYDAFLSGLTPKISAGNKPHILLENTIMGYRSDMLPRMVKTTWFDETPTSPQTKSYESIAKRVKNNFASIQLPSDSGFSAAGGVAPMRLLEHGVIQFETEKNVSSLSTAIPTFSKALTYGLVFDGPTNVPRILRINQTFEHTIKISFRIATGPWSHLPNRSDLDWQKGVWLDCRGTSPNPAQKQSGGGTQDFSFQAKDLYFNTNKLWDGVTIDGWDNGPSVWKLDPETGGIIKHFQNDKIKYVGTFLDAGNGHVLRPSGGIPLKIQWSSNHNPDLGVDSGTWNDAFVIYQNSELHTNIAAGNDSGFSSIFMEDGIHGAITIDRGGLDPYKPVHIRFLQEGHSSHKHNWVITDLQVIQTNPATAIKSITSVADVGARLGMAPNFEVEQMNYGQPKTFLDSEPFVDVQPADGARRHTLGSYAQKGPFSNLQISVAKEKGILSGSDARFISEKHDFDPGFSAYNPTVHMTSDADWLEWPIFLMDISSMNQFDGVIEFFSIRGEASRQTIESPIPARGIKGSIDGEYAHDSRGAAAKIHQFIFHDKENRFEPYEDSVAIMGSPADVHWRSAVTIPIEGYLANVKANITPWIDSTDWDDKVDELSKNKDHGRRDEEMASIFLEARESTNDFRPRGHRSATAGFYYDNAEEGTDSIAFGGLKK